jgi:hypothetical protein
MACNSIAALPRECTQGVLGGVQSFWIIAHKDLEAISGTDVYTVDTDGFVDEIGLASGKTYVTVGLLKSTAGATTEMTKNDQTGVNFFTNTMTLVLSDITKENLDFIKTVRNQPVSILMKTRTDKYVVYGLNGQLEISAMTGGTGVQEPDLSGFSLTFSGIERQPAILVQPALVPTIID